MKNSKYILYLLLSLGLVISSCKKDFLVRNPSTAVPIASAIKTVSDLSDAVNGMYSAMVLPSFYGRDIPVLGDLMADNVYISALNSGRYLAENNYSFISTNGEAADIFDQGYYVILQANRVIAAPIKTSDDVKQLKGEAYIARAIVYLQLVNFFAEPATVDPDALGVPIITGVVNPNDPYTQPARAKVSAVYAQIKSDLDSAYLIMPEAGTSLHPSNSEYLSKYAAKAIESRAYLYEGDYADAITAGLLVVNSGGYSLVPSTGLLAYWANPYPTTNSETIFELAQTGTINNGFDALASIYDQGSADYGDLLVTPPLYNLYTSTDVRKQLIIHASRGGSVLVNNKYSNSENQNERDDIKVIRYAEVLLTLSESYARTGDENSARGYLDSVTSKRIPNFAGYTSTGAALITDILNERRKELAFEGLRLFDLTRLNLDISRPQVATSAPSIADVPVGNPKRLLPIPQAEIDADPKEVQNPGYLGGN